jgi:hypothetical protein
MNRILFRAVLSVLIFLAPLSVKADVAVGIHISSPQPILFAGPPEMIVLPETNVYVVPAMEEEIFCSDGWWWRPWEGRWYRSRDYRSGWSHYSHVPSFYASIPSNWRRDYREHRWRGHQWNYQHIPQHHVQQNWQAWKKSRYWEKHKSWDVEGFHRPQPRPQRETIQQPGRHREINQQPRQFREDDQRRNPRTEQKKRAMDDGQRGFRPQERNSGEEKNHHGRDGR